MVWWEKYPHWMRVVKFLRELLIVVATIATLAGSILAIYQHFAL